MNDDKVELLKKLKALADRGVCGEKEAARRKLEALMVKYGIAEVDFADDTLSDVEFHYKDAAEKQLLEQVFYKINHERGIFVYTNSRKKVEIWRCTAEEAVRAKAEYEFYCDLWRDEVQFFLKAFIQKHRIFRTGPDAPTREIDRKERLRMTAMMAGMQDRELLQRIEGGKE